MRIFNSYTNKLEEFKPIEDNIINMYVCGPTVYNYIHIGNARPVVFFDVVRRYFEHIGYKVNFVSNFTDVDDKIIQQAKIENLPEKEISEKYIEAFLNDVERLGANTDYKKPKVTEYMNIIIEYINNLVNQGYAYAVDGDVYFRVSKIKDYGRLSNRKIEDLITGSRIDINPKKENPLDFTLWKAKDEGIKWDSYWGKGRPGWHTECVAMIDDLFDKKIDIHGGGTDLMFPHHENEIAQNLAINGHNIASYWMHNGRVNINNQKMSKSEGEMVLVKDLNYDLNAVRLFLLSTHYRSPINYTKESYDSYIKEWDKMKRTYSQLFTAIDLHDGFSKSPAETDDIKSIYTEFIKALENDFNTANAITALQKIVKKANNSIRQKAEVSVMVEIIEIFDSVLEVLGLKIDKRLLTKEEKSLCKRWEEARKNKNFELADELRNELTCLGVLQ